MARGDWENSHFRSFNYGSNDANGRAKWCSYKRTTLLICSINIVVALYVLHYLYSSLYMYTYNGTTNDFRYTAEQIKKMEESMRIRKESEPKELVRLVGHLEKRFLREKRLVEEVPEPLKWKIAEELLVTLKAANASGDAIGQHDAIESWREAKLREVNIVIHGKMENSTILPEEAGVLSRALDSGWTEFSESIGLWIPVEVINREHDDKPEGVEEYDEEILPGKRLPPECNAERHTDYGGAAVKWGLTNPKESAYDCCMSCIDQAKNAKPGETKCNIWVYCPSETGCHSPDIYEHKNQECWLKYAEQPKQTFTDRYSNSYRSAHPNAPLFVPWISGVVSV